MKAASCSQPIIAIENSSLELFGPYEHGEKIDYQSNRDGACDHVFDHFCSPRKKST
jgi:hypothetical protein